MAMADGLRSALGELKGKRSSSQDHSCFVSRTRCWRLSLAEYILHARPKSGSREVFLIHTPPVRTSYAGTISRIVSCHVQRRDTPDDDFALGRLFVRRKADLLIRSIRASAAA
jgi:hypothetical protein